MHSDLPVLSMLRHSLATVSCCSSLHPDAMRVMGPACPAASCVPEGDALPVLVPAAVSAEDDVHFGGWRRRRRRRRRRLLLNCLSSR